MGTNLGNEFNKLPSWIKSNDALKHLGPMLKWVEVDVDDPKKEVSRPAPDGNDRTGTLYQGTVTISDPERPGKWKPFDLTSGDFIDSAESADMALIFPDAGVTAGLWISDTNDEFELDIDSPRLDLKLPDKIRPAKLDATQHSLIADPEISFVRVHLPSLRLRIVYTPDHGVDVRLARSALADKSPDEVYGLVSMTPQHALIGPGETLGFSFDTAVLDLSDDDGPKLPEKPPANAMGSDKEWQGLWVPLLRLYVRCGSDQWQISAGVENMWIGFGDHAGVTLSAEAQLTNLGAQPSYGMRLFNPFGIPVPLDKIDPETDNEWLVPAGSTLIVIPEGGRGAHKTTFAIDGGAETVADRVQLPEPALAGTQLTITVEDWKGTTAAQRTITLKPDPDAANPPAKPNAGRITDRIGPAIIEIVSSKPGEVRLRTRVDQGTTATWAAKDDQGQALTFEAEISGGWSTVHVPADSAGTEVIVTRVHGGQRTLDAFFWFDEPSDRQVENTDSGEQALAFARSTRVGSGPASTDSSPPQQTPFVATSSIPDSNLAWTVKGYASYEGDKSADKTERNRLLSVRRAKVLAAALTAAGHTVRLDPSEGSTVAEGSDDPRSGKWWTAQAKTSTPAVDTTTFRVASLDKPVVPTPNKRPVPDWFHHIGVRCELLRGEIIRLEVFGEFDLKTFVEQQAQRAKNAGALPALNSGDGITDFVLRMRLGSGTADGWRLELEMRSVDGDLDGLLEYKREDDAFLSTLALMVLAAPIIAEGAGKSHEAAALVPLGSLALSAVLAGGNVFTANRMTLRGIELVTGEGPLTPGSDDKKARVVVLCDIDVAFRVDLGIVEVKPDQSLTARYKGVGVELDWKTTDDANPDFIPVPIFDTSKGYEITIPRGVLAGAGPLDKLVKPLGGRIHRTNPLFLEVDIGIAADTGPLTLDTLRIRVDLADKNLKPEMTGLSATLDIKDTIVGKGELRLDEKSVAGSLDVLLPKLKFRAKASVAVTQGVDDKDITGVLVGLVLEFPTVVPIAATGLGLKGFLGGAAINYARKEDPTAAVPALDWFKARRKSSGLDVFDIKGWEPAAQKYSFAAGVLVTTVDGGSVINLLGLLMVEIPGPRILFAVEAKLLSDAPELKEANKDDAASDNSPTGGLLAVVDFDPNRGRLMIGILLEFVKPTQDPDDNNQKKIIEITASVNALFTPEPRDWHLHIGTFREPVRIELLEAITGTGYLMLEGDGIDFPPDNPLAILRQNGFSIATGFYVRYKFGKGITFTASFGYDILVCFKPFGFAGRVALSGELDLLVASLQVSAQLMIVSGTLIDPATGTVDDFFFIKGTATGRIKILWVTIKGSVSLTIGDEPENPAPFAEPLVTELGFVSKPSVPLVGMANTDIDTITHRSLDNQAVIDVPIDVLPVLQFVAPPDMTGATLFGFESFHGDPGAGDGYIRRGDTEVRYQVQSISLKGEMLDNAAVPAAWWTNPVADASNATPILALTTSDVAPYGEAIPFSTELVDTISKEWETLCTEVPDPAPYFWTIGHEAAPMGGGVWRLEGATDHSRDPRRQRLSITAPEIAVDAVSGCSPCTPLPDEVTGLNSWAVSNTTCPDAIISGAMEPELTESQAAIIDRYAAAIEDAATQQPPTDDVCTGHLLRIGPPSPDEPTVLQFAFVDAVASATLLFALPTSHEVGADPAKVEAEFEVEGPAAKRPVTATDSVLDFNGVPGPAESAVHHAGSLAHKLTAGLRHASYSLYAVDMPEGANAVKASWANRTQHYLPAYFIGAYAVPTSSVLRRAAEITRRELNKQAAGKRGAVDGRPLLKPGETYTLTVDYEWETRIDAGPGNDDRPTRTGTHSSTFKFRGEQTRTGPRELDGHVMSTLPVADEHNAFFNDPATLFLSSTAPLRTADAYNEKLWVRVFASDGNHPDLGSPLGLPLAEFGALDTTIMTARHRAETVVAASGIADCIDPPASKPSSTSIPIDLGLRPGLSYTVDVMSIRDGAEPERVFRYGFSTGEFGTPAELAAQVRYASPRDLYVDDGEALTEHSRLHSSPAGAEFDSALADAGVPAPARNGGVSVLWSGADGKKLIGVLIDAPAPIVRSATLPLVERRLTRPDGSTTTTFHRQPGEGVPLPGLTEIWTTGLVEWLSVRCETAERIVAHPTGQRVFVQLDSLTAETRIELVDSRPNEALQPGNTVESLFVSTGQSTPVWGQ